MRRDHLGSVFFVLAFLAAGPLAAQQTVGLFKNTPEAYPGYTLMAPIQSTKTYLLDMDGRPVNSWTSPYPAGVAAYFLPDGSLLRAAALGLGVHANFQGNQGGGGRVERYDWNGNLVWFMNLSDAAILQHHDLEVLPNGNILINLWEYKPASEAIARGRDSSKLAEGRLWSEKIIEVQPTLPSGGTVVWEWSAWDHLVQDHDAGKANYDVVANRPERIDINPPQGDALSDFLHFNGIKYNALLDQIVISVHRYSEFWVIDHSTTTAQAAGSTGGQSGRGGDLLYRWGNAQMYDRAPAADQRLFRQHDAQWIPPGHAGAGNLLVFNNGPTRPDGAYSRIEEVTPPVLGNGTYDLVPGQPYGPTAPIWFYQATPKESFFSAIISGAQRFPNGNTLICEGVPARLFEIKPDGTIVWQYVNPVVPAGPVAQGATPTGNLVFKVRRYPANYPGLSGRTLVPGSPIEIHTAPKPVPDGSNATTPLTATRLSATGDALEVRWDSGTCAAAGYNLLFGNLADLATYTLAGSRCGLGGAGVYSWSSVPPEDLFFLVVGRDATGLYESSWGSGNAGAERNGNSSSFQCGVTQKATTASCP